MYCTECGNILPEGANFCEECGTKVNNSNTKSKASIDKRLKEVISPLNKAFKEANDEIKVDERDAINHTFKKHPFLCIAIFLCTLLLAWGVLLFTYSKRVSDYYCNRIATIYDGLTGDDYYKSELARQSLKLLGKPGWYCSSDSKKAYKIAIAALTKNYYENVNRQEDVLDGIYEIYDGPINPKESFVIDKLGEIDGITEIEAVTEDNDYNTGLNKPGCYTADVFFVHKAAEKKNLLRILRKKGIAEEGTKAGGSIEVYTNFNDAVRRCNYLEDIRADIKGQKEAIAGSCVIRISQRISAKEQERIISEIVKALSEEEDKDTSENAIIEIERKNQEEKPEVKSEEKPVVEISEIKEADNNDTENSYTVLEDEIGGLPSAILQEICGHYIDGYEDTVDIYASDRMLRYIKGGHEDHTYDEIISGYKVLNKGYLLKVECDGMKYTYLYTKKGNEECLYLGVDEGWDPNLNPYSYVEVVQNYKKGYESNTENTIESLNNDAKRYIVGMDYIRKEGNEYYLYPSYENEWFWPIEGGEDSIPFTKKVKIAEDAKIGVATNFYTTTNGDFDECHFTYEYYDFYESLDKLSADKQLYYKDDGYLYFAVDGQEFPLTPIVTFKDNGEIDLLLENYTP